MGLLERLRELMGLKRQNGNKTLPPVNPEMRKRFLAERNTYFDKPPKRRDLIEYAHRWGATGEFTQLQNKKRRGINIKDPYTYWKDHANMRELNAGLRMYLDKVALRAPAMPPKVKNFETGSKFPTLYRGIALSNPNLIVGKKEWRDAGYLAFSRDKATALDYALYNAANDPKSVLVLFRMNVRDVPPGTPWIWFRGVAESQSTLRKEFVNTHLISNNEVLLPPGVLRIKQAPQVTQLHAEVNRVIMHRKLYEVEVEYRPVSEHVPFTVLKAISKFKSGLRQKSRVRKAANNLNNRLPKRQRPAQNVSQR